jgi:hypothetical protein
MPSSELNPGAVAERIIASRAALTPVGDRRISIRKGEAEGGCGVIGMACSEAIQGRHLLQALIQMRNRGNGKGGGVALAGIAPEAFGVAPEVMASDYLLAIAYWSWMRGRTSSAMSSTRVPCRPHRANPSSLGYSPSHGGLYFGSRRMGAPFRRAGPLVGGELADNSSIRTFASTGPTMHPWRRLRALAADCWCSRW